MAKTEFDVCVIGTGAGGGVMIDQLTAAGLRVVALERGGELSMADFDDDELRNPIRDQIFSPDQLETWRPDDTTPTETGRFSQIAHCVGGTLTHWAAWSWRFRPDEFRVLSTEGPVAGASLADWPISYDDMEPFYEKAEWEFGVSGTGSANPFAGPRKKGFPNPAHPERVSGQVFARGAKKLGYTPFPVPMAINSRPYAGRPRCMYGGACRSYGCPIHAKGTTFSISLPRARGTGNLDLRPGAMVVELPMKDGRVIGARYVDAAGNTHEVRARQVVLAAGTVGTPHLLLLSSPNASPQGLANGSGLVGKNFQFHHHPAAVGVFDDDLRGYTGFEAHTAIDDLHPSDSKHGFIRGGVVAELNTFTHQPIAYSQVLEPALRGAERSWGATLKQRLRQFPRTLVLAGICEELPMEGNRVDLDPDVKDRFGLPVPRFTKRQHPNDLAMYRWYEKKLAEIVEAAGGKQVVSRIPDLAIDENTHQKGNAAATRCRTCGSSMAA
ncbi:MAG: GMC family oxidoreductase [Deltaproteobacteria bacterium]|nr:GMC family oxidoreductase [Deltaproteobacteria bacterium]